MRNKIRNILFIIGLAAVIIMLVTFDVSWSMLWQSLATTGYWLIVIMALWVVLYMMNTLTWRIILLESGPCPISFLRLLKLTISGFALNYATPVGLLGGEPYRIMELTPYVGVQRATSSVVLFAMMHIFSHFWYWVTAIVLWLIFMPLDPLMASVLGLSAIFCAAGIYLFLKGYRNGMMVRAIRWAGHIPGLRGWAGRFATSHADDLHKIDAQIAELHAQSRRSFYTSLLLEYIGRIMQSLEIFFILLLLGVSDGWISFVHSLLILAFTSLFANLLFFIPLQLGGREGGFAMSTAQIGLTGGTGLFISIIIRVRELFFTTLGILLIKVGQNNGPHMRKALLITSLMFVGGQVAAAPPDSTDRDLLRQTIVTAEASATTSTGHFAPLWLTSNHYGLGSVRPHSAYLRARLERDIINDSARTWRIGYGLDLAVAAGHERTGIIQQAYVEGAWKKLKLTIGAKQQPMETQNAELASGELTLGINARPIPQARIDIDWFNIPWTRGWWQWRIFGAFGWTTDGRWQEQWVTPDLRYARHTLYHDKALYWQFGRKDIFPMTYEIGIRMATQFGGVCYNIQSTRINDGAKNSEPYHYDRSLKAYWQALTQQGSDNTDGTNPNVAGNTLGSYIMQLCYHGHRWQARAYWERFFEDHSMLTVQYGIRDMLIGAEATLPQNPWLTTAVFEFMSSTNQSGAVYHDETPNLPDKMAGRDNYYNHHLYAGWQHFGLAIGNPLITSPLYNDAFGQANTLYFYNNRIKAWHVGLSGDPTSEWHWRAKASFTRNWGTYAKPLPDILHQSYVMAEATYRPQWASGWQASLALGLDHGDLIGNSFGTQLTVSKSLSLKP